MGHHLNFRDPDGIALELDAPNELWLEAQQALASGQTTRGGDCRLRRRTLRPRVRPP